MKGFWSTLPKPFFALAPLEDVTDAAFRRLIAGYGKPDVIFTEFTSADGLVLATEAGKTKLLKKLLYSEAERPIVAQLFTANPDHMEQAARLVAGLGFDGLDINMGCPDRAIEKGLCGSAMIKHPDLAREIIRAAKRGAGEMPVSVKTRIGYATNEIQTWIRTLLEEGIDALTIHARTRNEMSDVPARWECVKEVVELRDSLGVDTLVIGNGDLQSLADAREKVAASGADGAMLGRAIFGNPWLFSNLQNKGFVNPYIPTPHERIEALKEHIKLFDELLGDTLNFSTMKKHFKSYIHGWDGAKELRMRLMETQNNDEVLPILADIESFTN
ncbi:MAG TPA: tRNA-dihydrouridine synthase [Candidatus Paceibacterota bacterium]|nr:tRNA-dihydrouridine synthase [Candidatus Paceibacterota bacterium]